MWRALKYAFNDRVPLLKYLFLSSSKWWYVNFSNGRILLDKIVNSAEGTNLSIEEGPQTMKTEIFKKIDLWVFFKYHEVLVKNHKIFVKYHIAAPRKRIYVSLSGRYWVELEPSGDFRTITAEHRPDCLTHTCTHTKKGLEIVQKHLHQNKERSWNCLKYTCT